MSTLVNKQNKHGGSIRARDCYLKGVLRQYNQKSKVFMVTSSHGGHSLCRGLILLLTTSDRYPLCFQVNMFSNNFLVTRSVGSLFKRPSRLISLGHLAKCVHEFGYCNKGATSTCPRPSFSGEYPAHACEGLLRALGHLADCVHDPEKGIN